MKENNFHALTVEESLHQLYSSSTGISPEEAETRLHLYGFNELKAENKISPFKIFLEQFTSPLIWVLMFALVVSFLVGEKIDALVIGIIIVLNAILGFVQEYKAEKAIEALQKMASLKAKVIRNGKEFEIESKYLVPGDLIVLETGDKVPADARLIEVHDLETQEASLTGESQPLPKTTIPLSADTVLADRKNMVYNGTIITKGRGQAIISNTGMKTQVGKIATMISEQHDELTPLQKKLRDLGKYLTIAVIFVAVIVFLAGIFSGNTITVMFMSAVALAVAAIPEGLPAVITISLALGVQKMVKKNALVRRLPSVETLGSVDVICTDKTGTLTHNQMTVTHLWANNSMYEVTGSGYSKKGTFILKNNPVSPESFYQLLKIGLLCNDAKIIRDNIEGEVLGDPTEAALIVSAEKAGFSAEVLHQKLPRQDEIPFSSERKMMTTIHQDPAKKGTLISFTKGAPDIILENCDRFLLNGQILRLDRNHKKEILQQNDFFAKQALRVLGFAYKENLSKKEEAEKEMIFVGLQAMIDPPRLEVKESIQKCQEAGIRVIMITGDHLTTAQAIGKEIGIIGEAISGKDLETINLDQRIDSINIFARVNPEHKMKIVTALKKKGYVVAMTGDGVNDAPALKKADIGVAMGITGTDVAKEASDMILLDDNFKSIVDAVEEGRGIFDNIRKFVNFLLSSNLGEITVIFLASIFGMNLPLTAIQILWVNLVTDGLPATALGVDPHERGIMKHQPRPLTEGILSNGLKWDIIIFGVLMGISTLILFWLYQDSGLMKAQTIAFTALVIFEIARLQMIRGKYKLGLFSNKWLLAAVIISVILQLLTIHTPLSKFFGTVALSWLDYGIIIFAALILMIINKIVQYVKGKVSNSYI